MQVLDTNPYSKNYNFLTEAIVTFEYKGYTVSVNTNGTGPLQFDGAVQEYTITDSYKQKWCGKGCVEDAIKFIHNIESMKE